MIQEARTHENDPAGEETLTIISSAHNFNHWMFDTIEPRCKSPVLEVGSGIGNMSQYFLDRKFDTMLSDLRSNYCEKLQSQFGENPHLIGVRRIDLVAEDFDTQYADLVGRFGSIVALNVVEHIQDHEKAIGNCSKLLMAGGHLIILVPAYQFLYNSFDKELDHIRRYNKKSLFNLINGQGLQVIHQQYFNMAGIAGWFYSGNVLKKRIIPGAQMKLYNRLVPVFRLIDKLTFNRVGLSVIGIAKKTS